MLQLLKIFHETSSPLTGPLPFSPISLGSIASSTGLYTQTQMSPVCQAGDGISQSSAPSLW